MDDLTFRRARHVVSENERVLLACEAMRVGDAAALGRLLAASHASLRDDFQVSSRELDIMVEIAARQPGCLGARMTGAGFGGCAVALVEAAAADDFVATVAAAYAAATDLAPRLYLCQATDGAGIISKSPHRRDHHARNR